MNYFYTSIVFAALGGVAYWFADTSATMRERISFALMAIAVGGFIASIAFGISTILR